MTHEHRSIGAHLHQIFPNQVVWAHNKKHVRDKHIDFIHTPEEMEQMLARLPGPPCVLDLDSAGVHGPLMASHLTWLTTCLAHNNHGIVQLNLHNQTECKDDAVFSQLVKALSTAQLVHIELPGAHIGRIGCAALTAALPSFASLVV